MQMDLLKSYAESSDGASSDSEDEEMMKPVTLEECKSLSMANASLEVAPYVATKHDVGGVSSVVPIENSIMYNAKYSDLFQPKVSLELF